MAKTLTIEFTDELEQQMMVQAKQQQVSPESIVLQSLSQFFRPLDPETSQNTQGKRKKNCAKMWYRAMLILNSVPYSQ